MSPLRVSSIARHVDAAKRLLGELEQHAEAARQALGSDSSAEFLAAVNARERIFGELDSVVTNISRDRAAALGSGVEQDAATNQLLTEMAQAAARALESHEQLRVQATRARARLGAAIDRVDRPDTIASRYAVATSSTRSRSLSVTG